MFRRLCSSRMGSGAALLVWLSLALMLVIQPTAAWALTIDINQFSFDGVALGFDGVALGANIGPALTPEPATLPLLGTGAGLTALSRLRRRWCAKRGLLPSSQAQQ